MNRSEVFSFLFLRTLGNFLILLSLYGVAVTFGPALIAELTYRIDQARGVHFIVQNVQPKSAKSPVSKSSSSGFGLLLGGEKEQILIPKDPEFSIVIPKIGASAKIFPNIDPNNPNIFLPVLQQGVAHAKGTVLPGMTGDIYLFAHSTDNWWNVGRYNAVFYLLKDLKAGDDIVLFYQNLRYNYVVSSSEIGDASDVSYLVNSHGSEQKLILQTCWPPGTTWKRLFVIALPKSQT